MVSIKWLGCQNWRQILKIFPLITFRVVLIFSSGKICSQVIHPLISIPQIILPCYIMLQYLLSVLQEKDSISLSFNIFKTSNDGETAFLLLNLSISYYSSPFANSRCWSPESSVFLRSKHLFLTSHMKFKNPFNISQK